MRAATPGSRCCSPIPPGRAPAPRRACWSREPPTIDDEDLDRNAERYFRESA